LTFYVDQYQCCCRKGCSVDAIHAPLVAGISGGPKGAFSVALSGGYEDDVDEGYAL
jgi:E3 ubiquitin-protein ligase UHRF1